MAQKAVKLSLVEHRRTKVAELHLKGLTNTAIAQRLGIGRLTATKDLAAVQAEWAERRADALDAKLNRHLAAWNQLMRAAWDELEESRKPEITRTFETTAATGEPANGSKKTGTRSRGRQANTKLLDTIRGCLVEIGKLEGLYPTEERQPAAPAGQQTWAESAKVQAFVENLTEEERALFNGLRARWLMMTGEAAVITSDNAAP